jgi:8-oxo-dGTP pyrophosphatase MutT (NUDIX family)
MNVAPRRAFSVAVFARHGGRVLLIHHLRLGKWLPVGGEIAPGETPLEAARRELFEETGLQGQFNASLGVDGTPPGYLGYEEHLAGSKGLHMNFAFVADVPTREIAPNHEFLDFRWVEDPAEVTCPVNVLELGRMALFEELSPSGALGKAFAAAIRAGDAGRLAMLHANDAVHESDGAAEPIAGRGRIQDHWVERLQREPVLREGAALVTAGGSRTLVEFTQSGASGSTGRILVVLTCRDGKIVGSRAHRLIG